MLITVRETGGIPAMTGGRKNGRLRVETLDDDRYVSDAVMVRDRG